ncbi:Extracellular exo-alpha-L-arabinofuranosidase precursor [Posidoniimonas polymericola]|uniref:non-reducing end alpha-L-arabinofuranosidase n=1 Tax=Posidoniimonas polymericola TaxID=2528002 RepID=A0A5C5YE33_9BACT|nr:family 43 glycosylhydrolase [Posidoniimonas polymericola]TWT73610.1 Extracellular exo-alpha-L-arabinofuranosidase precursor [Posidoniimonas polymericola]
MTARFSGIAFCCFCWLAFGGNARGEPDAKAPPAVLPGVNADPHIAFFSDRCYLYPTTDGTEGWRSTSFQVWSSADLVNWRNDGVILDLPRDLEWADIHAWAPACATKGGKYYYYYSADKNIGVAVADTPTGPFHDPLGKPLVSARDYRGMQAIDPMVYVDDDNRAYLYWGQGRCKAVELNDDMISFDPAKVRDITPPGYNEGPFVHKRQGKYYLSWSEYDTRDPRYSVAYGTSESPLGPFEKASQNPILKQSGVVFGAGHHSIGKVPGRDEWVIAYHRFRIPDGDGYNRETCLSPLRHADDGTIEAVDVFEPVPATELKSSEKPRGKTNKSARLRIDATRPGKPISGDLFGVFFEDLNYAADGGLYAELVQNRSFEFSASDHRGWDSLTGWTLVELDGGEGEVVVESNQPLHANNPSYAVLGTRSDQGRVGLQNVGFAGIALTEGQKYDFSLFARQLADQPSELVVRLEDHAGQAITEARLPAPDASWGRLAAELTASRTIDNARLTVCSTGAGRVGLDMISLFPRDTFQGRKNGLRRDLAQAIADLRPKFVRFPGGCLVHGDGVDNIYRWQDSVGPVHQRKGQRNIWRYHQSLGLGYFEYFQFCEDIGAKPLPVVAAGVSCQNSGASVTGRWGRGQLGIALEDMPAYTQEVLDLIEYANGPADSRWGSVRAASGHPEPLGLEYLGVGNEDRISPEFAVRFQMIQQAIAERYPEITVVGTVGPAPDGEDFANGWEIADRLRLAMVDEHYYRSPQWFLENLTRYDGYDRSRSAVYLGEYAAHDQGRRSTLRSALAEAAYLTHLERNGDIVQLSSYAPLLGKVGATQWTPDLIYFTNTEVRPTINYYVQQLFSCNSGEELLTHELAGGEVPGLPVSVVRSAESGDLVIKLVNTSSAPRELAIEVTGLGSGVHTAAVTVLAGQPDDVNHDGLGRDLAPVQHEVEFGPDYHHTAPPHSLSIVRISNGA